MQIRIQIHQQDLELRDQLDDLDQNFLAPNQS